MSDIDSYVTERLDGQIKYFGGAASREQKHGKLWQNCLIAAAAATPLLIGVGEIVAIEWMAGLLRGLALASSFGAAVATGLLSTRRYWENGVIYRQREQALIREKFLWQQRAGPYGPHAGETGAVDEAQEKARRDRLLIESVEAIIADDVGNWTTRMKEAAQKLETE